MLQSSLNPGLLFQRCSSAYVARLPVKCRTVSSAERQYVPRKSTSTPSTSKIRIGGEGRFLGGVKKLWEKKQGSVATGRQGQVFEVIASSLDEYRLTRHVAALVGRTRMGA